VTDGTYRAVMSKKPSYLGLLNAVAVAERQAAEYLHCWAATTKRADVRKVLHTVALREEEHGLAFEKRIDELGYGIIDKPDATQAAKLKMAASKQLSDREKFELFRLGQRPSNGQRDVFDSFFANKDLDPQTGALLGRYIAEERDTGRKFAECYALLCAAEGKQGAKARKKGTGKKK
jgi:rubrerythrin